MALKDYMTTLAPGPVGDVDALLAHLASAWDALSGSDDGGMSKDKLSRMEAPEWAPPLLSFRIERHGAIVAGGSTRAELQHWQIDVVQNTAMILGSSIRQVRSMASRLDVQPLVEEIVGLIAAGSEHQWLRWAPDRSQVTVAVGNVIPTTYQQTTRDRRGRLRAAVAQRLRDQGWSEDGVNRFRKSETAWRPESVRCGQSRRDD